MPKETVGVGEAVEASAGVDLFVGAGAARVSVGGITSGVFSPPQAERKAAQANRASASRATANLVFAVRLVYRFGETVPGGSRAPIFRGLVFKQAPELVE
jgi:hypothetical protein